MSVRVLGVGNDLRGDDAAGLLVARRLRALVPDLVRVQELESDLSGLVEPLLEGGQVLVVDASDGPGPPGSVTVFGDGELPAPRGTSSHAVGLGEAVALARALGGRPRLRVYAVAGRTFEVGAPVSPEVAAAAARLADRIAGRLEANVAWA